jgi:hypothetical protein
MFCFTAANDLVNENTSVFIFPNPASDQLAIRISSSTNQTVVLRLFNSMGELVQRKNVIASAGENYFFLITSGLTEGNYLLMISDNELTEIKKVIIHH